MIRPPDPRLVATLATRLANYEAAHGVLPGVARPASRDVLLKQLVESVRRVEYVAVVSARPVSPLRANPTSNLFDPVLAALVHQSNGDIEEAFWMVFLFTHFGKHRVKGWGLPRAVYGQLGGGSRWDWPSVSANPTSFATWIAANKSPLRAAGTFGSHRKYESLDAPQGLDTGDVVRSYVDWVRSHRTHLDAFNHFLTVSGGAPHKAFDEAYRSMDAVTRFGRTARFDYLTMVGKLNLAPISPGHPYLVGATGPLSGARLLWGGGVPLRLGKAIVKLDRYLCVGMQPLEDALCNWQKSPERFIAFRG